MGVLNAKIWCSSFMNGPQDESMAHVTPHVKPHVMPHVKLTVSLKALRAFGTLVLLLLF